MVTVPHEIRVSTRKEKKALASLSLALSSIGLSIDDLANVAEILEENRRLRSSNEILTKRLNEATGGSKPDSPEILKYLSGIPTTTRPSDRKKGDN